MSANLPALSLSNVLYYGDNLDILRRHVDDESIDLICLDPPFNSNVLFAEKDCTLAAFSQYRCWLCLPPTR